MRGYKVCTFRIPVFFRKNEGGVPNIGMFAESIEGLLIHIEVSVAGYWRRVGRRQRILLHLFSIIFCCLDS